MKTAQEIAQHYSACMDSVNQINAGKPSDWSDADWQIFLRVNKEHLRIMLAKDFWTTENLTPLQDASA
jgi:hypothetical protein